jgi:uncharacterized membrane protein YfcA
VSLLYASVGQAGGSGYLAAMALLGVAPAVMKPTALVLNVLVAVISTVKFYRAGYVSWTTCWPFIVSSIPAAFVGGRTALPSSVYSTTVGLVLLFAAYRLLRAAPADRRRATAPPPAWLALTSGAAIGLISGVTGIGGGIILSALLLSMDWAETRQTLGVSALMNLSNSAAGILGHLSSVLFLPQALPLWAAAAVAGGWVGAEYGSRHFSPLTLQRLLAAVLTVAALKLILG